jgi:hypothetical protein
VIQARKSAGRVGTTCRITFATLLLLFGSEVAARDPPGKDRGVSGFGAPVVKYTVIRSQGAVMFGGRGGWYVTPSFMIGGGLYATISEVDAPDDALPNVTGPLDLKFDTFGLELEYAHNPGARAHPTFGLFLGGGAVRFATDKTDEQQDETDLVLVTDPSVGLELGITGWLHLNLAVSYRLVAGVSQPGLKNADFAGPAAALAAKIGRF